MSYLCGRGGADDSTLDILYNLYDRVAVGGYVVVDDFGWHHGTLLEEPKSGDAQPKSQWGAKDAVMDRVAHGALAYRSPSRPLGALLTPCTMWRTGTSPLPLPHLPHR